MFSQPVRQPGNAHAAEQKRIELGCPKHSAGKSAKRERQGETSVPKGNEENVSLYVPLPLSHLKLTF